jgi:hypothetical protein
MSRLVLALLTLIPLLGCDDPFRAQCTCTLKGCFEGVSLRLSANPDTTRYREFSVAIAYGDTIEAESKDWGFLGPEDYTFTSPRLRRQRPSRIEVRIDYAQDGAPKHIELDTTLAWTDFVCNHCSGNSSTCTDQISHSAALEVALVPHL